jgi:diguanylate cyclase (GGDEF)-like protein
LSALVFHAAPGFDALTGLPDRAAFIAALKAAATTGEGLAVLFLDLDDFKLVNDGFGHEAGDRLLIQVAQRLRSAVRETDLVARIGGDEFGVLLPGATLRDAEDTAARLRAVMPAGSGCSTGVAHLQPGESLEQTLERADAALYAAKRRRPAVPRRVADRPPVATP